MKRYVCSFGASILRYVTASLVLVGILACTTTEYVPAVSIIFADHDMLIQFVGSDRIEDAKFYGPSEKVQYDEISQRLIVRGSGIFHFLDVIVHYSQDKIKINGKDINLNKDLGDIRVVRQDGTVEVGEVNME